MKAEDKPLKRVYQAPICVMLAKIKRIRAHLLNPTNEHDRVAIARLQALERSFEMFARLE